jgi:hypothetical protein
MRLGWCKRCWRIKRRHNMSFSVPFTCRHCLNVLLEPAFRKMYADIDAEKHDG